MITNPAIMSAGLFPPFSKNDPMTTTSPVSGPTDRSIPPVRITHSWPNEMNARVAISTVSEVRLNVDRNRALWPWVYRARMTTATASTADAA